MSAIHICALLYLFSVESAMTVSCHMMWLCLQIDFCWSSSTFWVFLKVFHLFKGKITRFTYYWGFSGPDFTSAERVRSSHDILTLCFFLFLLSGWQVGSFSLVSRRSILSFYTSWRKLLPQWKGEVVRFNPRTCHNLALCRGFSHSPDPIISLILHTYCISCVRQLFCLVKMINSVLAASWRNEDEVKRVQLLALIS